MARVEAVLVDEVFTEHGSDRRQGDTPVYVVRVAHDGKLRQRERSKATEGVAELTALQTDEEDARTEDHTGVRGQPFECERSPETWALSTLLESPLRSPAEGPGHEGVRQASSLSPETALKHRGRPFALQPRGREGAAGPGRTFLELGRGLLRIHHDQARWGVRGRPLDFAWCPSSMYP